MKNSRLKLQPGQPLKSKKTLIFLRLNRLKNSNSLLLKGPKMIKEGPIKLKERPKMIKYTRNLGQMPKKFSKNGSRRDKQKRDKSGRMKEIKKERSVNKILSIGGFKLKGEL